MRTLKKMRLSKISDHPHGAPLNIIKVNRDKGFEVDSAALEQLFSNSVVKNRKVAILSIVGAFRKGKSFFLLLLLF